jgi:hypothetical protein
LQHFPNTASSDASDGDFPYDSDADEFGYTPITLGLENDDPRVAEIFGLTYVQKLERRKLRKPSQPPPSKLPPSALFT